MKNTGRWEKPNIIPTDIPIEEQIFKDSCRRDFTINSLYYDPIKDEIYDYHGGVLDIQNKVIKFVGNADERIKEDPLRMMRAIRFANTKGFDIEYESQVAIIQNKKLMNRVSKERILDEFEKVASKRDAKVFYDYIVRITNDLGIIRPNSTLKQRLIGEINPSNYIVILFSCIGNKYDSFPLKNETITQIRKNKKLLFDFDDIYESPYRFFTEIYEDSNRDTTIRDLLVNLEDFCSVEFDEIVKRFDKYKDIKKKYNGKFIMDTFGVKGKAVGDIQTGIIKGIINNDGKLL